jgi:fumarylpyruvate hydrolase
MPWDSAKAFDHSAPVSALHPVAAIGHPAHVELKLEVNGVMRQHTDIDAMVFSVAETIHELSRLWTLASGDLIFTGTPAGVATLHRGDHFRATLGNIALLEGGMI